MSHHTTADELANALPVWMPESSDSNTHRMMKVLAKRIDAAKTDLDDVEKATHVQTATTETQLDLLNSLTHDTMAGCGCLDEYRAKIQASYQNITAQGTPNNIIQNAANILGISNERIVWKEGATPGVSKLELTASDLEGQHLTVDSFADILREQVAAGFRLDILTVGSFRMTNEDELAAGTYDPATGFDELDANGDPTGYGGVYSTNI